MRKKCKRNFFLCKQYFNLYVVLTNHSAHITIRAEPDCNVKRGNCDICFHHNWH